MHLLAIRKPTTGPILEILDRMHRLRAKVFRNRSNWIVRCLDRRVSDEFDRLNPSYLIAQSSRGEVASSVRLLPIDRSTLKRLRPEGYQFSYHANRAEAA